MQYSIKVLNSVINIKKSQIKFMFENRHNKHHSHNFKECKADVNNRAGQIRSIKKGIQFLNQK
jgi:hypothetical protein